MRSLAQYISLVVVGALFLAVALTSRAQIEAGKIDRISSGSDIEHLLSSIDKKRFEYFSVRDTLRFGDASCASHANSLKAKSWTKADFDGNGSTDLLVLGEDFGPASMVIMNLGKGRYDVQVLSQSRCAVPVVQLDKPVPKILMDGEVLIFKFGSFVEENLNPTDHKIERIEYDRHGCFGECPVFKFDIGSDRQTQFVAVAYNKGKNGSFRTRLSLETYQQIVSLLNYVGFEQLNDNYSTGATDLAGAKLTVTYDGGKVKSIKDYGFRGPFGLQAIHRKFLDLREDQHWKR